MRTCVLVRGLHTPAMSNGYSGLETCFRGVSETVCSIVREVSRISALIAELASGKNWRLRALIVQLASGGFWAVSPLLRVECPEYF